MQIDISRIQSVGTAVDDDSIKIRGFGARRLMVTVDGRPLNTSGVAGGYFIDWTMIPLNHVDRVEVIKGVSDPRYGNVLGGVVNLVTRKQGPGLLWKLCHHRYERLSCVEIGRLRLFAQRRPYRKRRLPEKRRVPAPERGISSRAGPAGELENIPDISMGGWAPSLKLAYHKDKAYLGYLSVARALRIPTPPEHYWHYDDDDGAVDMSELPFEEEDGLMVQAVVKASLPTRTHIGVSPYYYQIKGDPFFGQFLDSSDTGFDEIPGLPEHKANVGVQYWLRRQVDAHPGMTHEDPIKGSNC